MPRTFENWRDTPLVGKTMSKLGKVIDIADTGCSPQPEIWVKAYFHALPMLIWTLFKPDPIDQSYERAKIRSPRGRGKYRGRVRGKFFEHPQLRIPGVPRWAIFAGDIAQRIGWYALIADASAELALNWISTAYRWEGCKLPGEPYAIQYHPDGYDSGLGTGWAHPLGEAVDRFLMGAGGFRAVVPAGKPFSSFVSWSCAPDILHPNIIASMRVTDTTSTPIVVQEVNADEAEDGSFQGAGVFHHNPLFASGPHELDCQILITGDPAKRAFASSLKWTIICGPKTKNLTQDP